MKTSRSVMVVAILLPGDPPPVSLPSLNQFPKIGTQGYNLVVDQTGAARITVAADAEHGVFNGAMTALQLLVEDCGEKEAAADDQGLPGPPASRRRLAPLPAVALRPANGRAHGSNRRTSALHGAESRV